jgi:hypothetical protein
MHAICFYTSRTGSEVRNVGSPLLLANEDGSWQHGPGMEGEGCLAQTCLFRAFRSLWSFEMGQVTEVVRYLCPLILYCPGKGASNPRNLVTLMRCN